MGATVASPLKCQDVRAEEFLVIAIKKQKKTIELCDRPTITPHVAQFIACPIILHSSIVNLNTMPSQNKIYETVLDESGYIAD